MIKSGGDDSLRGKGIESDDELLHKEDDNRYLFKIKITNIFFSFEEVILEQTLCTYITCVHHFLLFNLELNTYINISIFATLGSCCAGQPWRHPWWTNQARNQLCCVIYRDQDFYSRFSTNCFVGCSVFDLTRRWKDKITPWLFFFFWISIFSISLRVFKPHSFLFRSLGNEEKKKHWTK